MEIFIFSFLKLNTIPELISYFEKINLSEFQFFIISISII